MSEVLVKKIAAAAGTLAFSLVALGSWALGARPLVALIRGIEGFVVFGALGWAVGKWLQMRGGFSDSGPPEGQPEKGGQVDETA